MNLKLLALTLAALTSIGLTSVATTTSAYAQRQPDTTPNCRIDCDDDDDDGGDNECYDDCDGPTIPGNKYGFAECDSDVGGMGHVSAGQIRRVIDDVLVVTVCDGQNLMKQQKGVENIRWAIRRNDVMHAALADSGFDVGDVVGISISQPEDAVLYVHSSN